MPLDATRPLVTRLSLATPPMGGKCFVVEAKGLYLMEPGPGTLRTIACTHAGSGSLVAFDGVPDDRGHFPDEEMTESHPDYHQRNGRPIYRALPVVMGSWMLDAGFLHGLTIKVVGEQQAVNAVASVVWMPYVSRKKA